MEGITWAQQRVAILDPLQRTIEMPAIPEPEPEDLKDYLDGWSPFGPENFWGR